MVTIRFILTRIYYVIALLPLLTRKKIVNLLRSIFYFAIKATYTVPSPPILILTITNKCNFSCIMCLKNDTELKTPIDYTNPCEMEFAVLEQYLRKHADYLCLVRLHGGEPLFYKDIIKLIDLLNELKIPFNIITNGYLLTEELSKKLVNSYCVGIGFSLDSANSVTYEKMRRGGSLKRVTDNIDALYNLKERLHSKRPVFSASMCAFAFNVNEISELIDYCSAHHIPALSVVEGWDYKTPDIKEKDLISNNVDITHKSIRRAVIEAKKRGVILRTMFPSLSSRRLRDVPYHAGKVQPKNCLNLYASVWMLPTFDVIGCSNATSSFGSIRDIDFKAIWNGNQYGYAESRKAFRSKQIPPNCTDCIYTGGFLT